MMGKSGKSAEKSGVLTIKTRSVYFASKHGLLCAVLSQPWLTKYTRKDDRNLLHLDIPFCSAEL